MKRLSKALSLIRPNSEFVLRGTTYSDIEWHSDMSTMPTEQEVEEALLQIDSLEYREKRSVAYPSIGDQLDALFHAGVFPPEMAAQIQAVKDKYPKGS